MRKLLLITIAILCFSATYAQQIIQGTINDTDGKPIEFVSVGVKGTATGTITNEQGQFSLSVKTLPAVLNLSHLSYIAQELAVTNDKSLTVTLKPQVTQLSEVMVGDPALVLIKQASAKAGKNAMTINLAKAFSRQIMTEGDQATFISENFMDIQWQNWGITKYNITNARYLERVGAVSYTDITMFSYISAGYVKNSLVISPINHKPDSLYKFKIKETFKSGDQDITVVNCQLKDPDKITQPAFTGDIYINTETYDVLKTEGTIYHFSLHGSGVFAVKLSDLKVISQYKTDDHGNNVLDYSSFVMKSNVKLMGIGVKNICYSSTLFALNYDAKIDPATMSVPTFGTKEKDEDRIKKVTYDAEFWKNNPVIRRSQKEEAAITELENQKNKKGTIEQN